MRILFASSSLPIGGSEVFTINLAKDLVKKGNEVGVLVFRSQGDGVDLLLDSKIKVFVANREGKFNFLFSKNVYKTIKNFKAEAILSLSDFTYFFIEFLQKISGSRSPHIIAFHSLLPLGLKNSILSKFFIFFSKLWKGYYLFVSNNQCKLNRAYYHLSGKRSFIIHNGVDTNFFIPTNKSVSNKSLNIIHIANIKPEKDQWTLIKSLDILNKGFTDWKLTFVGKDKLNLLSRFKYYLQQNNLSGKVAFIEDADRVLVKNLLSSSDVFVLSSVMEVLPLAALEAMSMGLPCILTDVGGCSEIVKDDYNGYLVKPKDHKAIAEKLLYLCQNRDKLKQMSENARKSAMEKFDLDVCVGKYLNMFNTLINKGRSH